MKITLMEPLGIPQTVLDGYRSKLETAGHTFVSYASKTADPAEQAARVADSDAVIIANTPFPAPVILGAPNLKFIDVAFTGIDHVGLDACRQKGVTLSNAAGYSTQCVAELALGLAVACLRFVPACDAAVRQGGTGAALRGTEICGKTVGIVGTGAIGLRTARLFLAFGARVIAHSRTRRQEALDMGIEYVSLEELMERSDIVSLHVPSNGETRRLISAPLLARMKPTAILINAARGAVVDNSARGAVVDNAALADALNQGRLAGAGIDVFDAEPPLPESEPLLHAKNTVLTPHVAFATDESMLRRAEIVFHNLDAWLAGRPENVCRL